MEYSLLNVYEMDMSSSMKDRSWRIEHRQSNVENIGLFQQPLLFEEKFVIEFLRQRL